MPDYRDRTHDLIRRDKPDRYARWLRKHRKEHQNHRLADEGHDRHRVTEDGRVRRTEQDSG